MRLAMSRVDRHLQVPILPEHFIQLRLYAHGRRIITHDQVIDHAFGA